MAVLLGATDPRKLALTSLSINLLIASGRALAYLIIALPVAMVIQAAALKWSAAHLNSNPSSPTVKVVLFEAVPWIAAW